MSRGRSSTIIDTPLLAEPGPPQRQRSVRPYQFRNLEKIPYRHLVLMQRLDWLLPKVVHSADLGQSVRDRLHELFDEDVRLCVDYVHLVGAKSLRKLVPDHSFVGVVTTSAHAPRGLVEIELSFAHSIVDLLLGAAGSDAVALRPLTEIEQGVLSYVVLESFRAISPTPEPGRPRLRLEQVAESTEEALSVFADEKAVALIEFKALIGNSAGYLRMLLPGSMIQKALPPEDGSARRERTLRHLQQRIGWLSTARSWLRAEIGGTELTGADLAGLRSGDVLLLDALTTACHKGENGTATLRVGRGRVGHVEASVELADGSYQATVTEVVISPPGDVNTPLEADDEDDTGDLGFADDGGEGDDFPDEEGFEDEAPGDEQDEWSDEEPERDVYGPTTPGVLNPWEEDERTSVSAKVTDTTRQDAAELLNDVPLHVAVELARVPVTAEQIVSLHVGKILELGTAPGDPVNLSVNGKVVARGELVEVEGQLGVRILTLAS